MLSSLWYCINMTIFLIKSDKLRVSASIFKIYYQLWKVLMLLRKEFTFYHFISISNVDASYKNSLLHWFFLTWSNSISSSWKEFRLHSYFTRRDILHLPSKDMISVNDGALELRVRILLKKNHQENLSGFDFFYFSQLVVAAGLCDCVSNSLCLVITILGHLLIRTPVTPSIAGSN